ncbi:Coagulin domain containing protein, partial [Euroglyphus maynei]
MSMENEMHKPAFIPISQPSLPSPHHPIFQPFDSTNPFLFVPPLSDTSAIDYWLKLLEDPKFEEQIMPILFNGRNYHRHHSRKPFDYDDKFFSDSHLNNGPWVGKKNRKVKINSRNSEHSRLNLSNKRKYYSHGNKEDDYDSDHYEYEPHGDKDKWSIQNDIENGPDLDNLMMLTPNVRPKSGQRAKKPRPYTIDDFHQHQQQQNHPHQQQQQFDITPRCDKFTEDICIDDFEYPENAILDEIYKRKDIFQLMYAEVNGEVPLVDGITKDMDENFSQDYYYSNNDPEDPDDDYHDDFNGPQTARRHHLSTNKSTSFDFDESNNNHHSNNNNNYNNKNFIEQGFVC